MRRSIIKATLVVAALALCANAAWSGENAKKEKGHAKAKVDHPAPNFTLKDINGKEHSLSDYKDKYVVLEWNNMDCPFVKKHYDSGNMQALQKKFGKKEVVWLTICSSAPGNQGYYESAEMKKRMEKAKFAGSAYLMDPDGKVGRMFDARTTPHLDRDKKTRFGRPTQAFSDAPIVPDVRRP